MIKVLQHLAATRFAGVSGPIVLSSGTITDWITAVSGAFAAVGTVGAVIVALHQIRRQERRRLSVQCRSAVAGVSATIAQHHVTLRATNDGLRPVKITQAYIATSDHRQTFSTYLPGSDELPKLVLEGESVEIAWSLENLDKIKAKEGFDRYLYAFFTDTLGNLYSDAYPGMKRVRRGWPWKRIDQWEPIDPA